LREGKSSIVRLRANRQR